MGLQGLDRSIRANAQWCLDVAHAFGVPVTVTSTYRSWSEQAQLYQHYQRCLERGAMGTGDCRYPANRPGDSAHEFGLAWDSSVPPVYQDWWDYVRQLAGFEVLPNDRIHAQYPGWRSYV